MDKIKVCHVTSVHRRYDPRIFLKECRSLAKEGYDVTLLVSDDLPEEVIDGVKIVSIKFNKSNRLKRILFASSLMLKYARQINASIYHIHDSELLPIAVKLKKSGKKVIYDMHEDTPLVIMWKDWIPLILRKPISYFVKIYEKRVCKKLDALITVTPFIFNKVSDYCKQSLIVTNYPIIGEMIRDEKSISKNSICFAGAISKEWNHESIITSMMDYKNIRYILAGKGPEGYLKKLKSLPGWDMVDYKGFIPRKQVLEIYHQSIVGIALYDYIDSAGGKEGTLGNTKLFEYMEAGLPVICTDFTLWKEIVESNNCGLCVNPKNVNEISQAIKYMIDNPKIAEGMGKNARKAVIEKFNWSRQEIQLLKLYDEIAL